VVYPYYEIQRYPTNVGVVNSLISTTVQSANIQLHSIPNKMYILARQRNADQTAFTSDVFAAITNVNINWNNKNGLLSAATPFDLYKMSVANGLQLSYSQFINYVGSPICVTFGKDVCLDANECPGLLGTYQLQLQVTFTNPNASTNINYDLYIITVSEGCITIEDNRSITQIGVMSQNDVINSLNAPMVDYNHLMKMRGASFWSNVKDFFVDAGKGIKKAYDVVSPYVGPAISAINTGRKLLGYGRSGGDYSGGAYSGGVANEWTKYVRDNAGSGKSKKKLAEMYHEKMGTKPVKKAKKAKKTKKAGSKKCAPGKVKKRVMRCEKKGGVLYEGGDMMDRDEMSRFLESQD
jgi:hypothetical protein